MKTIALTQSKFALVSDVDYAVLRRFKWWAQQDRLSSGGRRWYARTRVGGQRVFMHRLVAIRTGRLRTRLWGDVDHRNGDGLDNQRGNLRTASRTQNLGNRGKTLANTSGYKGVTWDKARGKWKMQIKCAGKFIQRRFNTKRAAARAYAQNARRLFGQFARAT